MLDASSSTFNCCAFCPTESRNLYKCPKCRRFYCSTKCYRNKRHVECSERFYQTQCQQMEGGATAHGAPKCGDEQQNPKAEPPKRPTTTFEEYMKDAGPTQNCSEDANPQIEVNANEEIVFDSDDEPDYLLDVARTSADQFNALDMDELDRQLLLAGISPGIGAPTAAATEAEDHQRLMENLYEKLTADERKAFARLADGMLGDAGGGAPQSCFRPKSSGGGGRSSTSSKDSKAKR